MRFVAVVFTCVALSLVVGCGKSKKKQLPKTTEGVTAPTSSPDPGQVASSEPPKGDLVVSGGEANLPKPSPEPEAGGRCLGKYTSASAGSITFYKDHTCMMEANGFVSGRDQCAFSMSEGEVRITAKKQYSQTGTFAEGCQTATFGGITFNKVK